MFVMLFIVLFYQVVVSLLTVVSSDVMIRLYLFRFDFSIIDSISIRFGFDFFTIPNRNSTFTKVHYYKCSVYYKFCIFTDLAYIQHRTDKN